MGWIGYSISSDIIESTFGFFLRGKVSKQKLWCNFLCTDNTATYKATQSWMMWNALTLNREWKLPESMMSKSGNEKNYSQIKLVNDNTYLLLEDDFGYIKFPPPPRLKPKLN